MKSIELGVITSVHDDGYGLGRSYTNQAFQKPGRANAARQCNDHRATSSPVQKRTRRSSSVINPIKAIPKRPIVATPASAPGVSRLLLESSTARPRPRSPLTHSAIAAPSKASVLETLIAAKR